MVTKEVESWKGFEYVLRSPNSSLFNMMLKECLENEGYAEAFKAKGAQFSVGIIVYGFDIPATKK